MRERGLFIDWRIGRFFFWFGRVLSISVLDLMNRWWWWCWWISRLSFVFVFEIRFPGAIDAGALILRRAADTVAGRKNIDIISLPLARRAVFFVFFFLLRGSLFALVALLRMIGSAGGGVSVIGRLLVPFLLLALALL